MRKNSSELISVIIPAYNSASFLADAIESVLAQTHPPSEIIVVDDGSTDQTKAVVKGFDSKVQYIYQENHGPSHARNRGLEIANGTYIAFLDADDVWLPFNLSNHLEQFKKFRNLDISIGLMSELEFEKASDVDLEKAEEESILYLSLCSSLIKKDVFDEVGKFDEDLLMGEDTDWFLRAKEKQRAIAISRQLVTLYRRHARNSTNNRKKAQYYFFKIFKNAKDRRKNLDTPLQSIMKKPENYDELIEIWHNAEENVK